MPNTAADPQVPVGATTSQISWLALTRTPGLGPTRANASSNFLAASRRCSMPALRNLKPQDCRRPPRSLWARKICRTRAR